MHFGYHRGQPIIRGVTATLSPARLTVLLGPNAAGKSTLMRLMLGQIKPNQGQVTWGQRAVAEMPPAERAGWLSYVPQRAGVTFAFSVQQVVSMGRYALPKNEAAVEQALAQCDLEQLRDAIVSELSVGQQQRVLLARAMAQAAGTGRVMLLDEPGSAMDLWHVHAMMRQLQALARGGMAVLTIVHDLNLAAAYADEVWLVDQGRLIRAGPWDQVLRPDLLEPLYRVSLQPLERAGGRPVFLVGTNATMD